MLTAGVDLAAQDAGTALATIRWYGDAAAGSERATLVDLRVGVDDASIVSTAREVDKLGIDCAFGWPDEFVDFVRAHSARDAGSPRVDGGMDWRRTLAYRETDRVVRRMTGRWPLSVSTDRLGLTAMRCAGLLDRIDEAGVRVDRAGSGVVVEVYPGASLRLWGFTTTGYRTDADRRAVLLEALLGEAPWLDLGGFGGRMIGSADAFDAVVAALAARSAALGLAAGPEPVLAARAEREGWVALPSTPLGELV